MLRDDEVLDPARKEPAQRVTADLWTSRIDRLDVSVQIIVDDDVLREFGEALVPLLALAQRPHRTLLAVDEHDSRQRDREKADGPERCNRRVQEECRGEDAQPDQYEAWTRAGPERQDAADYQEGCERHSAEELGPEFGQAEGRRRADDGERIAEPPAVWG